MIFPPGLRRLARAVHVSTSVALAGAVLAFLVLALSGWSHGEDEVARAMYVAMNQAAWLAVLPLAIGALATGLVESLGTAWGLFRHYWVVAKLVLTVATIAVLAAQLSGLGHLSAMARAEASMMADMDMLRMSAVIHAAGGLVAVLGIVTLSIYKPGGLTAYGRRHRGS